MARDLYTFRYYIIKLISFKRNQLISAEKYSGGSKIFDDVGGSRNLAVAHHVFPRWRQTSTALGTTMQCMELK